MQHTAAIGWAAAPGEILEPPCAPPTDHLRQRAHEAPQAAYGDACERVTDQTIRAYGVAFTWWMTGRGGFELGPGTRAEQHARITQHYRKALRDRIEHEIDRQVGACPQVGLESRLGTQEARQAAHRKAQALFLRGQYRVNLLFFTLFAELERDRKRVGAESCLLGATATRAQPPRAPEP